MNVNQHVGRSRTLRPLPFITGCIVGTFVALCMNSVMAQERPATTLLGGPSVDERSLRTLVNFDANGRLARIEGRPEEAALELLNMNDALREQTLAALNQRALDLGLFLVDHLDQLRQLADALKTRDSAANRAVVQQLYDEFDPDHARDPLMNVLIPVLSTQQQRQVTASLDEYWAAWIDQELAHTKDRSESARQKVQQRLTFGLFEQELRRSFDWSIRPYREKLDLIDATVRPTDEQREAIRTIVIDFIRKTRLDPTPEQRLDALKRIYLLLDVDRRTQLFEMVASLQNYR